MRSHKRVSLLVTVLGIVAWSVPLAAQEDDINLAGARVDIAADDASSIHAAGALVTIRGKASQDIMAAGARVDIDAEAGGDLNAVGSRLSVEGEIMGEAWLAGAELKIGAVTGSALKAVGAWIEIVEGARLGPDSSLAAALVEFRGLAGDNLRLEGDEVVFSGLASGSVAIDGGKVRITEEAKIDGHLTVRSREVADISPAATIAGDVTPIVSKDSDSDGEQEESSIGLGSALIFGGSTFLLGLVLVFFTRGSVEETIATLRYQPGRSILWGLAVFVGVPVAAVVAIVTVVGIPMGVVALLAFPFLLLLGVTATVLGVSDWILNRSAEPKDTGERLLIFVGGVAIFAIISLVPVLGALSVMMAVLFGLGATSVTVQDRLAESIET